MVNLQLSMSSDSGSGAIMDYRESWVDTEGIEPSSSSLSETCTNRLCYVSMLFGSEWRDRTPDAVVNGHSLYR